MKNVILLEFKLDLVKNAVITCKDIFLKQHNRFIASGILASKPKRPEAGLATQNYKIKGRLKLGITRDGLLQFSCGPISLLSNFAVILYNLLQLGDLTKNQIVFKCCCTLFNFTLTRLDRLWFGTDYHIRDH